MASPRTNRLIIISGPSGAGEDTIIQALEELLPIERVITTTTRTPRYGEANGAPYYFVSKEEFQKGVAENRFFEHAKQYNGELYGVTHEEIERVKHSDHIGIWKVEFQGVEKSKKEMPEVPAIFIIAPPAVLERRIRARPGVNDAYVAERMAYTKEFLDHKDLYDYTVVNDDGKLEESIATIKRIIEKEVGLDTGASLR